MPVRLATEDDSRRQAFLTHALGEWLVVRAVILDLVRYVFLEGAILTLLVWQVLICTFAESLTQIVIKALMLHEFVILFLLGPPLIFLVIDHFDRFLLGVWSSLCGLEGAAVAIGGCCILINFFLVCL